MAVLRPGVYVEETLNPVAPVVGPNSASVGAFIGANDRGPIGTPTLITSWSQYSTLYGTWNTSTGAGAAGNDLPLAVYMFFTNGGSQCYVNRVANGATSATRSLSDRAVSPSATLQIQANNAGAWGNNINISIANSATTGLFDLFVYYGGNTDANLVERHVDLSMTATNARYATAIVNAASGYVRLTDLNSANTGTTRNPAVVTNQTLATGINGNTLGNTDYATGLTNFDTIKQSLIMNVPGNSTVPVVNAAIGYANSRQDVFVVIDGIYDESSTQLALAAQYTASSLAAVYYPNLVISDPTLAPGSGTGRTRAVGSGAAVMGVIATTDASRGVFKAPAGLLARLSGVVSIATLTNGELDTLNSAAAPVNAIKFVPGSGIVIMGSRTLKGGYVDKYVPVRRTLIYLRKSLTDLTEFAIFEPNDEALWNRINSSISTFLTDFWSKGGLRGATPQAAFFVKVDAQNNPQSSIDNGYVNIEVGVALQRPAEFIIIKIGQFDGGATVTVA
jgi:phage tail sheath protein FI